MAHRWRHQSPMNMNSNGDDASTSSDASGILRSASAQKSLSSLANYTNISQWRTLCFLLNTHANTKIYLRVWKYVEKRYVVIRYLANLCSIPWKSIFMINVCTATRHRQKSIYLMSAYNKYRCGYWNGKITKDETGLYDDLQRNVLYFTITIYYSHSTCTHIVYSCVF